MPIILGLPISHFTVEETVALCLTWTTTPGTKLVFTPNPEIAVYAHHQANYRARLRTADLLIPDGTGIYLAGWGSIPERVTGVDIMLRLLAWSNVQSSQIGFVLRRTGLSNKDSLTKIVKQRYPHIRFTCWYADENIADIVADFLFVGLGFPEQENWCYEHRLTLAHVKVMLAVGGSMDYLTGQQCRAPSFLRTIGLEWLWRLSRQPWRLKRVLTATITFPWLIFKERYGHNH